MPRTGGALPENGSEIIPVPDGGAGPPSNLEDDEEDSDDHDDNPQSVCGSPEPLRRPSQALSATFPQATMRKMKRRMAVIVRWDKMLSCVAMSGNIRLNAHQYSFLVRALRNANPDVDLKDYREVTGSFWRNMLAHALPKSVLYNIDERNASGPRRITATGGHNRPGACVRIVVPSDWARVDMSSDIFYRNVFESSESRNPESQTIEDAPIVQNREIVCGAELVVWADFNDAVCPCEVGDKVQFPCSSVPRSLSNTLYESPWTTYRRETAPAVLVEGYVGHVWCVSKNAADASAINGTAREKAVYDVLKSEVYPTYPSIAEHLNHQRTLEDVVNTDILQLCPGDLCAFIRTDSSRQTNGTFCLLVASPVLHAYGQPPERLVWVQMEQPEGRTAYARVMARATVNALPLWVSGSRPCPNFQLRPVANKGVLRDGMPYYIYRVAL